MQDLNLNLVWKDVLESIKVSVSPAIYNTWFLQTHLISFKKNEKRGAVEVGCNSPYVKSTIESRYFGLVQDSLSSRLGVAIDVLYVVKENLPKKDLAQNTPLFQSRTQADISPESVIKASLRPGFTFDNFAVSSSNQMAWAAAEAVSKNLGHAYNPLFIWGGVGVGKTHLMNSIGYYALQQNVQEPILLCTGEQFTNDIVEGIRNKSTQAFRNKYRKLKILMIDDIQFIAGKVSVQEEFFHTFNTLVASGSQIILTSDRPPSEISKLEERLKSRFEAGLIVDIAPPDFELRCAIVQIKAKEKGMELPMDIVQLIAGNLEGARKIEGALVKIASEVLTKKIEITPEMVESVLGKGQTTGGLTKKVSPDDLVEAVSKYYSLKKRLLMGESRQRPIARPRQILMYLLRIDLDIPLAEIGKIVGGRDHTTVMHAVNKITRMASVDVQIREDIRGIKSKVSG